MDYQPDNELIQEHLQWLRGFDPQYASTWKNILSNDPEAAACEAAVRRALQGNGNVVEPYQQISPDFICTRGGEQFFVEVTCIRIASASEKTGLPPAYDPKTFSQYRGFKGLNEAIYFEAKNKAPQCANLGKPAIVAVGTFHWMANLMIQREDMTSLLTGTTYIADDISPLTGGPVGESYISTKLEHAAFLRARENSLMHPALKPISGILVCGFDYAPPILRCVLHPDSVHVFDRSFLPQVECCRLKPGYKDGKMMPEWL
jgi:hypothetical protein